MNASPHQIKKILGNLIKKQWPGVDISHISVEKPREASHGDYATNIALVISKSIKKNPMEIAQTLRDQIPGGLFAKIQVAPPGFINFFLVDAVFVGNIKKILKEKEAFGANTDLKNNKVMVEYTDPNILKDFHIGHLMSNSIGESLSRILQFSGATIKRACYQSDVGLGIAKAVWGKIKEPALSWQQAYVLGTKQYEEYELVKKEIIQINKKIFDRSDATINAMYDEGRAWSLAYFEAIYAMLGTQFDYHFFESAMAEAGRKIVLDGLKKGIFQKGENGAVIFKGEEFGLHTRVFVNSEGLPTYEAKDLALPQVKYKKYKYDRSVIITASEQNEYFKVMLCALEKISPDLAQKTKHIGHGMMRLPEGKMSSRTGKVITAESLIDKVKELVLEKISERDLDDAQKAHISQLVAIGALKYSVLKQSIGSDIIYDVEKSVSFQGDSGAYLQYSLARAISVLKKAKDEKIKSSLKKAPENIDDFIKMMHYFPEVVTKAATEYQPHYIALYITELAAAFNHYYSQHKIVDKNDELSPYNVAVTQAFSIIMKNGLWLLGIPALEKM